MLRSGAHFPSLPPAVLGFLLLLGGCTDRLPTQTADQQDAPPGMPPGPTLAQGTAGTDSPFVPGSVLVGLRPGADPAAVAGSAGGEVDRELGLGMWRLAVPAGVELALAETLARNPNVTFAEPDWIRTFGEIRCHLCEVTGDNFMGYKWDLGNDGTIQDQAGTVLSTTGSPGADVRWEPAFLELGADYSGGTIVAILDTGMRGDHQELTERILGGYNFHAGNSDWADDDGHGTHVAGIIGARGGNGVGIAGIAWGPDLRFLAVKVCGPIWFGLLYGCTDSAITQGINWSVDQGARVLNLSLGGASMGSAVQTALQNALAQETLPICAAGNNGQGTVSYPAAFAECVAVSATNWSDQRASYSNWGPEIEISAPGGDLEEAPYSYILSSYYNNPGNYAWMAGTSMAAPQVSGLAALLYSRGLTQASQVRNHMAATADDLGDSGWDPVFGNGRINVGQALAELEGAGGGDPPGNQPPVADFTYECAALDCTFTDQSFDTDGEVTTWFWEFGDGSTSDDPNPQHTFAEEGVYTVTLAVTDEEGATGETSQTLDLRPSTDLIVADFSVVCEEYTCTFTNLSYHQDGTTLEANWDLGDGSGMYVMWEPPPHTYPAVGDYEVIMVVLAADFSGWTSHRQWVSVPSSPPPPDPDPDPIATTMSIASLEDSTTRSGPNWEAWVTVTVRDDLHAPVEGASVTGSWTESGTGVVPSCVTLADGTCQLRSGTLRRSGRTATPATTFNVEGLGGVEGLDYDETSNEATSVTVQNPG